MILLFLFNLIFYLLFVKKLTHKVEDLSQVYRNKRLSLLKLDPNLGKAEGEIKRFKRLLLPSDKFTLTIDRIISEAKKNELDLKRIDYSPTSLKKEGLVEAAISFSAEGGYPQVKGFIYSLENFPNFLILKELGLDTKDKSQKRLSLNGRLVTYLR